MGGVTTTFSYATWTALFPEFLSPGGSIPVTTGQATQYFTLAEAVVDNTGCGPVCLQNVQDNLLYLATSHIAAIFAIPAGAAEASTIVGRIKDASEGTVRVSTENDYPPGSAQWWQQTKYGAMFWAATSSYRSFQYVAAPARYSGFYR